MNWPKLHQSPFQMSQSLQQIQTDSSTRTDCQKMFSVLFRFLSVKKWKLTFSLIPAYYLYNLYMYICICVYIYSKNKDLQEICSVFWWIRSRIGWIGSPDTMWWNDRSHRAVVSTRVYIVKSLIYHFMLISF